MLCLAAAVGSHISHSLSRLSMPHKTGQMHCMHFILLCPPAGMAHSNTRFHVALIDRAKLFFNKSLVYFKDRTQAQFRPDKCRSMDFEIFNINPRTEWGDQLNWAKCSFDLMEALTSTRERSTWEGFFIIIALLRTPSHFASPKTIIQKCRVSAR